MDILMIGLGLVRRYWQRVGPYLLVELLLPGGSLVALLLLLYRSRNVHAFAPAFVRAAAGGVRVVALATTPRPALCLGAGR
jgi:hypothetical protein